MFSIAPMERYTLDLCGLQGGGLYIEGTATLTNTNVYSNQAFRVCSLLPLLELLSIAPMETDLALAAGRAVASLSDPEEWLTLKAVVSMTTPLIMCACILNFP